MSNQAEQPPLPVALTIAGSDSGGGAGVQADLKTFTTLGVFGCSAITAITAQNSVGVRSAQVLEGALIRQQIDAVAEDFPLAATKTGMLATRAVIEAVVQAVQHHRLQPLVVDPVMVAKSGDALIDDQAIDTLSRRLLPLATIVTPNWHEAARLTGMSEGDRGLDAATEAARVICRRFGAAACVVKGIVMDEQNVDVFFDGQTIQHLTAPHCPTSATHGSGCTFSAAICAALARGQPLIQALQLAKQFITRAITHAPPLGHGSSPVNVLAWLEQ